MHYPEEIVILLLFIIIDQVGILFGVRFVVITNTDDINIHASRESHASREVMHREIMHCELTIMCDEKISCFVKIYARREDVMPRQNLYIARRIHTSSKFMHHEKNPCLVEILHIARRFHASLKVMHRDKIHTSREFTYRGKVFMPRKRTYTDKEREIVYPKSNIYQSASIAFFCFDKNKHQEEYRR